MTFRKILETLFPHPFAKCLLFFFSHAAALVLTRNPLMARDFCQSLNERLIVVAIRSETRSRWTEVRISSLTKLDQLRIKHKSNKKVQRKEKSDRRKPSNYSENDLYFRSSH